MERCVYKKIVVRLFTKKEREHKKVGGGIDLNSSQPDRPHKFNLFIS